MFHCRLAMIVLALMAPVAAHAADGSVYVYLQPFPREAAGLTIEFESASAAAAGGAEQPLALKLATARADEMGRQRLLAAGRVPAGAYGGVLLRLKRATVRTPGGDTALALPESPLRIDVPCVVGARQSPVIWVSLTLSEPVRAPAAFAPAFSAVVPPRPIADHAGFVSSPRAGVVTVFDKQIMQAVGVIETCASPSGLALDQRRRRLYVACPNDDQVESIDVVTGDIVGRASASPGDRPRELALAPDGTTLLSVNRGSDSVSFYETGTLARQDRVSVGTGPGSAVIDSAGRRAFVFNTLAASVSVVDMASRAVVATLSTEASPLRGQISPRGDRLYVIYDRLSYLSVFDTQQLASVARARVSPGLSAMAVDWVRGLVALGGVDRPAVEFYDPNALMPLYVMRTRSGASYLATVPEDDTLYVVSPATRSLLVGRLGDRKIVSEIDVGDSPYWVAVMGEK